MVVVGRGVSWWLGFNFSILPENLPGPLGWRDAVPVQLASVSALAEGRKPSLGWKSHHPLHPPQKICQVRSDGGTRFQCNLDMMRPEALVKVENAPDQNSRFCFQAVGGAPTTETTDKFMQVKLLAGRPQRKRRTNSCR